MTFKPSTEIATGTWLHNPVTGELARLAVGPAETGGRRLVAELWLQPGAAVAGAHVHPHLVERFTVLSGEVGFELGGVQRAARAGDAEIEVPAGVLHDWWNVGDGVAQVRVEVEAEPGALGRPAARFAAVIEALWSLGALGEVDARGMPNALWLGAIAHEYRDMIRFAKPSAAVQGALFPILSAVARATGRDPLAPKLHGARAACVIPEPSEDELADLLARRVGPPEAVLA